MRNVAICWGVEPGLDRPDPISGNIPLYLKLQCCGYGSNNLEEACTIIMDNTSYHSVVANKILNTSNKK
jgi:hypothetical protein